MKRLLILLLLASCDAGNDGPEPDNQTADPPPYDATLDEGPIVVSPPRKPGDPPLGAEPPGAEAPVEVNERTLELDVLQDGSIKIHGRLFVQAKRPWELGMLIAVFKQRRQMRRFQEDTSAMHGGYVNYTVLFRMHPDTSVVHFQKALIAGVKHGGVTRFILEISGDSAQVKGRLPRDADLSRDRTLGRVYLCSGGELSEHQNDRAGHAMRKKSADEIHIYAGQSKVGVLNKGKSGEWSKVLSAAGKTMAGSGRLDAVVVDPDENVPIRHVFAAALALQAAGIKQVEYSGTPLYREE